MKKIISLLLLFLSFSFLNAQKKEEQKSTQNPEILVPSITHHTIILNEKKISYTATAGYLKLKNESGEETANIFFISYIKDDEKEISNRPISFSFNGGPGSSSVWMHMGLSGPKRVLMTDNGDPLPPPYKMVPNEYSWLDLTDLIYIDPVSTGFSHASKSENERNYHGYQADIESVGDFIRRFISENKRWSSPKFLIGESYGTTRAAGLSEFLGSRYGMYLNGIILVSMVTNFQTITFIKGNDLPFILYLPSYTVSAYYHKKLSKELQSRDLRSLFEEVKSFANIEYNVSLMKGDLLDNSEIQKIAVKLSNYTGLPQKYIEEEKLRINNSRFMKELLRENKEIIGRFDSRYKAVDLNVNGESPEFDPSYQPAAHGAYSSCINDYLAKELGVETFLPYEILTGRVNPWGFNANNQYFNVTDQLRKSINLNPEMKIWIASGYFDLATPVYGTEYTINHLGLPLNLRDNITLTYYEAGHMMYLNKLSLEKMKMDAMSFYKKAIME